MSLKRLRLLSNYSSRKTFQKQVSLKKRKKYFDKTLVEETLFSRFLGLKKLEVLKRHVN